jgi:glutaredoxin
MFCERTKAWLSERKIPFTERRVDQDPTAIDDLVALGFQTTPVVKIGATVIVGFDPDKIARALDTD